jgi:hypothetical protein
MTAIPRFARVHHTMIEIPACGWVMARYQDRPERLALVQACHQAWEELTVVARKPSVYQSGAPR